MDPPIGRESPNGRDKEEAQDRVKGFARELLLVVEVERKSRGGAGALKRRARDRTAQIFTKSYKAMQREKKR